MNRKSILRLTAAAMAISTVSGLSEGQLITAKELLGGNNDEILSDSKEDIIKSEITTGQAVNIKDTEIQENENVECIDIIKAEEKREDTSLSTIEPIKWTFDNSAEGWGYGGTWAYNGSDNGGKPEDVSQDAEMKALKVKLDYSNEGENSWSEYKLQNNLDESINLNGYNVLTYDFIYDPSAYKKGSFKTKLFMKDIENENQKVETDIVIDLNNAEKLENGLKKVKVTIEFANKDINIQGITLGIIGSNTTYKGNIYIDNITLDQVAPKEVYVEKTAVPDNNQPKVTASELEVPSTVKLVDSNAIDAVGQLYGYLMGLGKSDKVIFGHQNDTHRKAIYTGGSESDTKDITGSISGIVGIDTLSFTGDELTDEQKSDADKRGISYAKKCAEIGRKTAQEGGILTVSAHMPNFALVKEKGKDKYGKYDYTNYSASTTYGNVVDKILPGGELNDVYTGYLDIIAEYAHELKDIPIIFRPFHENNGSWFWWGGSFCDSQTYKSLYAYTVEYLRDEKGVHNFLYVYSPNGPFKDADDYLSRYPGDEFVDVIAFDMYHENPSTDIENDPWFESLRETMELVDEIAKSKGKLSAATELGVKENGGGLSLSGNANKQWFKIVSDIISKSDMPYYMTWANFNTSDNFFAPFMADENKGHEMINDFIDYYNDENSVFANQIGDYTDTDTTISNEAYSYGYIVSPVSRIRILEPTTIKAKVKNIEGDVKFVLKDKEGKVLNTVQGKQESNEVWTAQITKEILDSIGEVNGTIELQAGDKTLNYIKALFNMKEPEKQPRVVDDFEGYMGDDSLLTGEWAPNVGPGCSVTPSLSTDHKKNGEFGLTFEYKISTAKTTEGYAGITKSVGSDWSGTDALQFWITPDGYGQKLIIQITSNGEEFEVNLKDIAATTEPQLVTIDFSEFKGKKGGKLGLSNIEKFGIYCNTILPDDYEGAWTVNSKIYFDDIKAIDTNEVPSNGGNSSSGGSSSSGSSSSSSSSSSSENNENTESSTIDKTGWVFENGSWSYIQEDGTKKIGWFKDVNGTWYYLQSNGEMKTGWLKDTDGKWYYLESNGAMKTGWLKDTNGKWYYLESNGAMKTGWLKDTDGKWYYLESNGAMKTGWFKDTNDKWYYLDNSGAMLSNTVVDGYKLDNSGAWI